ncbi:M90 family metallopeptidase [Thiobacillus sedimenti]|uniref:M90 family metallopeptidase n=1 Tax=Thiobacillus sedimenti TaxID=3110231 RepID=A0ABZ1CLA6_9PROT|nr:M90 family metallopeptidase [Thiobacillus sp. SCUT-2]WRS40041.1 M90 family metallopeptidase [Thiobacillus sp. SCUT-2]
MSWFSRWRRERILRHHLIPAGAFNQTVDALPILEGLADDELQRLREQASLLLHDKTFSAAGGAVVDARMQLAIAVQASLLTLNLDEASYRGWSEIILYPDEFLRPREEMDEAGVVHHTRDILAGESWHGGPLVLSLADVAASGQRDGFNVVLHEFAHKLDMLNGDANGFPPLHRGMSAKAWAQDFGAAYEAFCARVDAGEDTDLDPYASNAPAEFFAVLTEAFFETPALLHAEYPAVYGQLQQFYRQHPLARAGGRA